MPSALPLPLLRLNPHANTASRHARAWTRASRGNRLNPYFENSQLRNHIRLRRVGFRGIGFS
jgi:hypothetical protein